MRGNRWVNWAGEMQKRWQVHVDDDLRVVGGSNREMVSTIEFLKVKNGGGGVIAKAAMLLSMLQPKKGRGHDGKCAGSHHGVRGWKNLRFMIPH